MFNPAQKGQMHNYLPAVFSAESQVDSDRIFEVDSSPVAQGPVVYLMEREIRLDDNFALNFATQKAKELNKNLKIIHPYKKYEVKEKQTFIDNEIFRVKAEAKSLDMDFEMFYEDANALRAYLKELQTGMLILDFNPISEHKIFENSGFSVVEIDGHNVIPARHASDKQELSAYTFRRHVYNNIGKYLTEIPRTFTSKGDAHKVLADFIENKLTYYSQYKNNPLKDVTSGLSLYTNLGFISSQRIVLDVAKSDASQENKETFLEEMIVRKELSDNFCFYNEKYKNMNGVPNWAKETLKSHCNDIRSYLYSLDEFEAGKTHDNLWNAAQKQLLTEGKIQGYLRMYWAKKIAEWSPSPENAIDMAIYLNDKYAYDAPAPNGYVGILWSIAGLHDRAFQERPVTGKIRTMTYNGSKSKFDVDAYINKFL